MEKSDIKDILKKYSIGTISKTEKIWTSGNITFLITTKSGRYVLRFCTKGNRRRSKKEILAELELVDYLLKENFPAPKPIANINGDRIINWHNYFGYLKEYNEGKIVLNPSFRQIERTGKLIGNFHNLIENYKTNNKRKHIWDLKETRKLFLENKNKILKSDFKNAEKYIAIFEKEINFLHFPSGLPKGTIHEDLRKQHILWQKNKISAVLDFDRCYFGYLIMDLGCAIRSWCFSSDWKKWKNNNLKHLLKGYANQRKLKFLEKKYLLSAVKFNILERSLSFCLRYIFTTKDKEDEKFAQHSLEGLLSMLKENEKIINSIIKAA